MEAVKRVRAERMYKVIAFRSGSIGGGGGNIKWRQINMSVPKEDITENGIECFEFYHIFIVYIVTVKAL